MTSPMFQYSAVALEPGESVSFGDGIAISLDGNHAYSITGWIRLRALGNDVYVLTKGTEFVIFLNNGVLGAQMVNQATPLTATDPLELGQWHSFAVTYSPNGSGGGLMTLYVDGAQQAQASLNSVGTSDQGNPYVLGASSAISGFSDPNLDCLNVCFWSEALAQADIQGQWQPPAPQPSLAACLDFSTGVASDISGNNTPISFSGGAALTWYTPGVLLENAGAQPSALDNLNPGGVPGAPFTVSAWVYAEAPLPDLASQDLTVLANGPAEGPGNLMTFLAYNENAGTFTWTLAQNAASGFTLAADTAIAPEEWHYVAATYDGTTATLYVDGVAAGSGTPGTLPALAQPLVVIGAAASSAGGVTSVYQGLIEAVAVWTTALSAADITTYMTTPPASIDGLAAFFDFSTQSLFNTVTGTPIALFNGAQLSETSAPVQGDFALRPRVAPAPAGRLGPVHPLEKLLRTSTIDPSKRPQSRLMTGDAMDEMITDYGRLLDRLTIPPELRGQLEERYKANLYAGFHLQDQAGTGFLAGVFTVRQEGAEHVFYHHTPSGPQEVGRYSAQDFDACTAWIIAVVCSAISLLLTALGAAFAGTALVRVMSNFLGNNTVRVQTLLRLMAAGEQPTTLVIRTTQTIYGFGGLSSIIGQIISGTSWWNFAFTVLSIVLQIASIWLTGGLFLAYLLARLALAIASFVSVLATKPSNC